MVVAIVMARLYHSLWYGKNEVFTLGNLVTNVGDGFL